MGGLTFQSLVDFFCFVTEFQSLDSVVHKVAWGSQKPKKVSLRACSLFLCWESWVVPVRRIVIVLLGTPWQVDVIVK
jgi:hypothetical protein